MTVAPLYWATSASLVLQEISLSLPTVTGKQAVIMTDFTFTSTRQVRRGGTESLNTLLLVTPAKRAEGQSWDPTPQAAQFESSLSQETAFCATQEDASRDTVSLVL